MTGDLVITTLSAMSGCQTAIIDGIQHYGYWYQGSDGGYYWHTCSQSLNLNGGAAISILLFIVLCFLLIYLVLTLFEDPPKSSKDNTSSKNTTSSTNNTSQPMMLLPPPSASDNPKLLEQPHNQVERIHSQINLAAFVAAKFSASPAATSAPPVQSMTYVFGEPENDDDHSVKLYLRLSQEERAYLKRHGYDEEPLQEEPLFSELELDLLRQSQELELSRTADPHEKASLRIEHREQLNAAREAKHAITIADLLRYPFERTFQSRRDATRYRQKLEEMLGKVRKILREHED